MATSPAPSGGEGLQRRPGSDGLRRVEAAGRDVFREAGDLTYRYPVATGIAAAFITSSVVTPVTGHGLLDLAAGATGGFVAHRYITRHSYARDRAVGGTGHEGVG